MVSDRAVPIKSQGPDPALDRSHGTDLEPEFRPPRPGDVRDPLASLERIGRVLGYRPLVRFDEGLRLTVEAQKQVA
jgi:nucleoside-diphosphate-sugar epimerase